MEKCQDCKEGIISFGEDQGGVFCDCCGEGQYKKLMSERPRYYTMDLEKYNKEFLIEIIKWKGEYIKFLEIYPKYLGGKANA